jgi:hypothetical protein
MIVLRCTSKLLSRLATKPADAAPASSNALGDWYATLLRTKRGHYVLAIARNTLLPIVVSGRELRAFPERLAIALAEVLAAYGVPAESIGRDCAAMSEVQYARDRNAPDRRVLAMLGARSSHVAAASLPNQKRPPKQPLKEWR